MRTSPCIRSTIQVKQNKSLGEPASESREQREVTDEKDRPASEPGQPSGKTRN